MSGPNKIQRLEQQLAEYDETSDEDGLQKIDLLNELAWELFDIDNQRARELSETAYALAESSEDGHPPYEAGLAYSLRTQGYLNMRSGDFPTSLAQHLKAQQIFESLHLDDGLLDVFGGITSIYFFFGDYPLALDMAYKRMDAAQHIGDKRRIADANNSLANINFETGRYGRALDFLTDNLKFARELKYDRLECATLVKLEQAYLATGEYQLALENGLQGLHRSRELGYQVYEIRALRLLGQCYLAMKDEQRGMSYLEEALDLSRNLDSKQTETLVLLTMGAAYKDLDQLEQAKDVLHRAVEIVQSIGAKNNLSEGHLLLSEVYQKQGDHAQALDHFKQYYAIRELIAGEKSDQRVKLLEVLHDVETIKKEAEIAHLRTVELQHNISEKERVQQQLQSQLHYEQALAHCSNALLMLGDTQETRRQILQQALEYLRIGYHTSRAYLFRNFQDPDLGLCTGIYAEACARGIHPLLDDPTSQKTPWTQMPPAVFEALQKGRPIGGPVETLFADLPSKLENYRQQHGPLLSVLLIPVFIREQWWGFVGVDDGADPRQWDEREILILDTASGMIASTLRRWQAKDKAELQLSYARALSACSQTLMTHTESEEDYHDLLARALQHLMEPTQAGAIYLMENIEDPKMGLSSRVVCRIYAPDSPFEADDQESLIKYREAFLQLSNNNLSDPFHPQTDIIPWSLFPADIPRQLANGYPVGRSVKDLRESNPLWGKYLFDVAQIYSIQLFPILFNNLWWGTISLDDRIDRGQWDGDELLLLYAATEIIKNSLQRRQAEVELQSLNNQLELKVEARTTELRNTIKKLSKEVGERERAESSLQELMGSLEQHLIARTNELATFFDLILMAGQGVDLDEIFDYVVPRMMEFTGSQSVVIDLFEGDGDAMNMIAQGNLPEEAPARIYVSKFPPELRNWMQGPNEPLLVADLAKEIPSFEASFNLKDFPYQTYLGAQIRVGDRIDGILSCFRTERGGYSVDVVALVTALAQQLGLILEIDRLRRQAHNLAVLEERGRLARDLHDSVTQSLYSLSLFSRAGREAAEDGDTDRLRVSLAELEANTLQALREMRLLLYELRPSTLNEAGLVQALEARFNTVERRAGLTLDVRMDEFTNLSSGAEVELYNVVIETMNNIIKHANAIHVAVELVHAEDGILLRVVDDGRGFDPSQNNGGMGLTNIKERIDRLNGQVSISSEPGGGTRVEALIPYPMEAN